MGADSAKKLVNMANQIAINNSHYSSDEAAADVVANHLKRFWAPAMREAIKHYAEQDCTELLPITRLAVRRLP